MPNIKDKNENEKNYSSFTLESNGNMSPEEKDIFEKGMKYEGLITIIKNIIGFFLIILGVFLIVSKHGSDIVVAEDFCIFGISIGKIISPMAFFLIVIGAIIIYKSDFDVKKK